MRALPGQPDPWAARDASVDVVIGLVRPEAFAEAWLAPTADATHRRVFASAMEAQRWRLAMFASCGWFWEDPVRIETAGALRAAVRAARLIDGLAGTDLEGRLVADLALIGVDGGDGVDLLRTALSAVGVGLDRSSPNDAENPSARGLRATG